MRLPLLAILLSVAAAAFGQQTYSRPGTVAPNATTVQGCHGAATGCVPVDISGTISTAGAADTVGNDAAFNANSVCAIVSTAGQPGAGFFLGAGTLAATLTPSVSEDATPSGVTCSGGNYTASKFIVDVNGNTAVTLVVTNPNAFVQYGVATLAGTRCVKVCTTSYTSGTATGHLTGTVVLSPSPAPSADVTDRAGRLLGKTYGSDGNILATANTGRLQVDVISGGGSNGSVVTDGAAPASSDTQVGGSVTTSAPTYTTGQVKPFSLQTDGSLRVAVTAGGGSNASVGTTGSAVPGSGTFAAGGAAGGAGNLTGTTVKAASTASAATDTALVVATRDTVTVAGTVTTTPPSNASTNVAQFGGNNVATGTGASGVGIPRVTVSNDSTVGLVAGTAIVGKVGIDQTTPGTTNGVQVVAALPAGSNVIGHVIADTGSTTAATQATASNLNAQVQGAGASGATKAGNPVQVGAVFNTTQPTVTTGQTVEAQATARGGLIVATGTDTFNATVSGTVTTTPPADATTNVTKFGGTAVSTGTGAGGAGIPRVTVSNDSVVGLATGSNTIGAVTAPGAAALALDASVTGLEVSQGSTTSGQKGALVQGAVTTSAPSYTTAQTSPLSLQTNGSLRTAVTDPLPAGTNVLGHTINDTGSTTAVTGNVTVVQPTGTNLHAVLDTTSTTAVTQPTGTNLHSVTDSGSVTNATLQAGTNSVGSVELNDGEFGTSQAKVLSAGQSPRPKDSALVVALSPTTPINIVNIGAAAFGSKPTLGGPILQMQHVDERGHVASVKGPLQPPNGTETAAVVTQSPLPAPVCTSSIAISQTANTRLVLGAAGKRIFICSILVVSSTAQSIALTEGTGTTCGTAPTALIGSTTVANGPALAANGGFAQATASPFKNTQVLGDDLCLLQSGAGNVSGAIDYTQF